MTDRAQDGPGPDITRDRGAGIPVYVVIREDQNAHGFVDTSIVAAYRAESDALARLEEEAQEARNAGVRVCGDFTPEWQDEADWEVSWMVDVAWLYESHRPAAAVERAV
jgi:hypothetical protein